MSHETHSHKDEDRNRHDDVTGLLVDPTPKPQPVVGHDREIDSEWAEKAAAGFYIESAFAALGSVAAVVGLVSPAGTVAGAVAVILFALGLLVAAIARRLAVKARTRESGMAEVGGISTEYLVGGPALVLGIFALAGIVPAALTAVAALGFGIILTFAGTEAGRQAGMSTLYPSPNPPEPRAALALKTVTGVQMLLGIAVSILAVLSLAGIRPVPLLLLGLLGIGLAKLLGAGSVAWRMARNS